MIGVAQLNNVGYCGYILTSTKSGSYSKVLTIGLQGAVAGDAGVRRFTGKEFGDSHSPRCTQERVNKYAPRRVSCGFVRAFPDSKSEMLNE